MAAKKPLLKPTSLLLASVLLLGAQPPAYTATAEKESSKPAAKDGESAENVTLNFNSADIDTVIRAIGKITGRNFLIDPRVKGNLNIVTSRPVPRTQVYPILLSALRLQGFAAVEESNVTKILPEADAKLHSVPTGKNVDAMSGDRVVTEIFQIKHEAATQLIQVVRPLITANNTVSVFPGNNTIVVTDYAENVARIRKIIESIDIPPADSQLIRLQNASAVDLAQMITKLYNESTNTDPSMKLSVIADARTNSLLVRSDNRARIQAVRELAAQLDQNGSLGRLRVVYLKNGDATRIAQTLRAIASNDNAASNSNQGVQRTTTPATTGTTSNSSTSMTSGSTQASFGSVVGGAYIYADTSTNSLVINAPDALYNNLRAIIDELDRRPAQIYVEALIVEVDAERAAEMGIQWQSAVPGQSKTTVFGGTNFGTGGQNILTVSANPASASKGLNLAIGGGSVNIPGVGTITNISMLARYLQTDSKTNILSTPSLVTVDNEEAKIVVGSNVPFVTGSFTNSASGASNPFQTIERKDVGLTLKIRPQITEGGSVRMMISQEASSVIAATATASTGPSTNKRSLDTTVIVDDGSILALGGLVEDQYTGSVEKVPVLGDIPILGALFRYDSRSHRKTNLVIFLRPVILRNEEDAKNLSNNRYDYIIGQQKASSEDKVLPKPDTEVQLPLKLDQVIEPSKGRRQGPAEVPAPALPAPSAPPASTTPPPDTPAAGKP